jgi:hypothetical protein
MEAALSGLIFAVFLFAQVAAVISVDAYRPEAGDLCD